MLFNIAGKCMFFKLDWTTGLKFILFMDAFLTNTLCTLVKFLRKIISHYLYVDKCITS